MPSLQRAEESCGQTIEVVEVEVEVGVGVGVRVGVRVGVGETVGVELVDGAGEGVLVLLVGLGFAIEGVGDGVEIL